MSLVKIQFAPLLSPSHGWKTQIPQYSRYLLVASTLVGVSLLWPLCTFLAMAGPADRCTVDIRFDAFSAVFAEIATKLINELLSLQRKKMMWLLVIIVFTW